MTQEITITLPDGSQKQAQSGVTGAEIAGMIGAGLAKAAIAFEVNGEQRDLSDTVLEDSHISIFTADSDEGLEIMRHTCLLYTSPSPRDATLSRMPSSA